MKIGFAGNVNNYPFMLARALLRMGHEVEFIVDSDYKLNRPEFRYADIQHPYPEWIHDFTGVPDKFWKYLIPNRSVASIRRVLEECDALIVNNMWPILARKLQKPYIAILTGSDLETCADYDAMKTAQSDYESKINWFRKIGRQIVIHNIVTQQRSGIREANGFIAALPGLVANTDRVLSGIRPNGRHVFGLMTDIDDIAFHSQPNNSIPRILCAARLTWKLPMRPGTTELDYKGTDILLKGFALYLAQGGAPMRLTLVRKGLDIEATQALVAELNISESVDWLDEMTQSRLLEEYLRSDIIADQFARSIVSMAGLDAMATGRPLLANGRPEVIGTFLGEPSPICQATSPEEVSLQLFLLSDPVFRTSTGQKSRNYVERNFSGTSVAQRCLKVFHDAGLDV